MWVDPFFREWWATKGEYEALPSAYTRGVGEGPMRVVEYHMNEDFNADWSAAAKWTGFFEFYNHCVRDLSGILGVPAPPWAAYTPGLTLDDGEPGWW